MTTSREATIERIADLLADIWRTTFSWKTHAFPSLDITLGELRCMMSVGRLGTPSMTELSKRLQLKPSTVTAFVDRLVKQELAARTEDPQDRRMVRVALTEKGKRLRGQKRRARRRQLVKALADLDDDQLRSVLDALETVHDVAHKSTAGRHAGRRPRSQGDKE